MCAAAAVDAQRRVRDARARRLRRRPVRPRRGIRDAADLALAEFFVPILKGWATEDAVALTSDAIQVHGGMGFIEETGAAQHYRDARIMPIYEARPRSSRTTSSAAR
jgi:alkylation response protein AidB-like acyl-CoA dehydrogenase